MPESFYLSKLINLMNKFLLALVFCSLFTACETFNKAAYTELQKQQIEKDREFQPAFNPAEKLNRENYPSYEEYKEEKESVIKDTKK